MSGVSDGTAGVWDAGLSGLYPTGMSDSVRLAIAPVLRSLSQAAESTSLLNVLMAERMSVADASGRGEVGIGM